MAAIPEAEKLLDTNSTATSFEAITRVTAGDALTAADTNLARVKVASRYLEFEPFGAGSDGASFNFKIIGASKINTGSNPGEYKYITLYEGSATLHTETGVSGRSITDTDRFCDSISLATSNVPSKEGDTETASLVLDVKNYEYVYVTYDRDATTSCNGTVRFLEA